MASNIDKLFKGFSTKEMEEIIFNNALRTKKNRAKQIQKDITKTLLNIKRLQQVRN